MGKRTAILVTGSRDWHDRGAIEDRLKLYPPGKGTVLLHGDCGRTMDVGVEIPTPIIVGADWIASQIGHRKRFKVWPLPYFDDLGQAGGPRRNETLLRVLLVLRDSGFSCFVEAFPLGESRGTRGMIELVHFQNGILREPIPVCVTEGSHG